MSDPTPINPNPYHYFVSYSIRSGFGCAEVNLDLPIRSMSDVRMVTKIVAEAAGEPVIVISYQLFADSSTPED